MGRPRPGTPLINIIKIFMGQNLVRLPTSTFTRFVVTLWYLYGLLMKTAYQSFLFQLLRGRLYHEPPQGLDDLINGGCKLVATEGTFESVATIPRLDLDVIDFIKLKNISEQSTFFYVEEDAGSHCLAGISPLDFLTYHVAKENKRGVFFVLPEKIFAQHITMYFTKHSFLINRFNFLFMNLRSMGLIDFWARKSLDLSYFQQSRDSHFKPVAFDKIKGVFFAYIMMMSMAVFVFLIEIAVFEIGKIIK